MSDLDPQELRIPIEWEVPDDILTRYVTNIVVQHDEHDFIISFFEARPPVLVGSLDENRAKLETIESIKAECVARIVVSAKRMPGFVAALQTNLEQYRTQFSESG